MGGLVRGVSAPQPATNYLLPPNLLPTNQLPPRRPPVLLAGRPQLPHARSHTAQKAQSPDHPAPNCPLHTHSPRAKCL